MAFQISESGIEMTYGPTALPSANSDITNEQKNEVFIKYNAVSYTHLTLPTKA